MIKLLVLTALLSTPAFADNKELSFEKDVQPILTNRCVKCHNSSGYLPDVTEYETAFELRYKMQHKLETKKMPYFGKMTITERDTVLEWIKQGAKK